MRAYSATWSFTRQRLACVVCGGPLLFPGGAGSTDKDPVRSGQLMDDLERKVFGPLPDDTHVYPEHGEDTTLGAERPGLQWRERGW